MAQINIYSSAEMKEASMPEVEYRINPLISTTGTVFNHGPTSVGKTVLAVQEAISVATGEEFLGLPTTQGRVAFLEIDTPELLFRRRFKPRLDTLDDKNQIRWVIPTPFDCLSKNFLSTEPGKTLKRLQGEFNPDFVIVDTLRKIYFADEKSGDVPTRIYSLFQLLFPNAAIQFNAHDRKASRDISFAPSREDFSGHQARLNDAQSGLHITRAAAIRRIYLELTKSQWSDHESFPKMTLSLSEDGCSISV